VTGGGGNEVLHSIFSFLMNSLEEVDGFVDFELS
jgi:hypothetical protein